MKNTFIPYSISLLLLIIAHASFGQILSYNGATDGSISSVATNATGTPLYRVNGALSDQDSACALSFSSSNFSDVAIYSTSLAAVEVSVTPDSGYSLDIADFTANLNRSGSGPASARFAYSTDGGSTWTAESSDESIHPGPCGKGYTLSWSEPVSVDAPQSLKLRIYGFDANKTSGTQNIYNLQINGNVSSIGSSCGVAFGLSASNITSSSATLSWDEVSGATGYNIQFREAGTGIWNNTTSTTSFVDVSGLTSSTDYEFQVQTVCSGGTTSAFSPSATFTTSAPACGVASGLSVTNITSSSATLNWSDVSGATGYNVQYRKTGTATWTSITSITSSFDVSGLTSSTTYEFHVQTICSGGSVSTFSSSATFTTSAPTCGIASGLSASSITSLSATLDWNDVSGATGYNIRYRITGTTIWTSTTSTTSSLAVSGLISSTIYEFQVQTVCSGGTTSAFSTSDTFTTLPAVSASVPTPDHVVILILENHGYSQIIGSSAAPHINALANDASSALFTQSFAIEHPSQPNYLDFYSGSNQGVTDDNVPAGIPFTTPNLGRELIDASLSFTTYSEDLPSVGYNGATSGAYARKHNPVANWMGTGTNQVPPTTNQPFTAFPTDFTQLPTVSYVVPNQNNDMHNGTDPSRITTADNWMYNNLNDYIQWAKTHNSLFILTFDEDNGSQGNRIVTIFTGAMVAGGQYSNHIDHYNILRTIEDMYGLPYAGNPSSTITNCWKNNILAARSIIVARPADSASSAGVNKVSVYPNPSTSWINFSLSKLPSSPVLIRIFDMMGRLKGEYEISKAQNLKVNIGSFSGGNYYYHMIQKNTLMKSGFFSR